MVKLDNVIFLSTKRKTSIKQEKIWKNVKFILSERINLKRLDSIYFKCTRSWKCQNYE